MKSKIFGELVLIAASILCVFVIGILLFAGGSFIEGISKKGLGSGGVLNFLWLLSSILFVVSVFIAWFKRFIGSLLITIFAIAQILLGYTPEIAWLQLSLLLVGPLLFMFYCKSITEKKKA